MKNQFSNYYQPFLVGDLVRFGGDKRSYRVIGIEKSPYHAFYLDLFMNFKNSEINKIDSLDRILIYIYIDQDGKVTDEYYRNITGGIELIDRPYHNLSDITCRYYCKFKHSSDFIVDNSFCKECKYFPKANISASSLFFIGDEVMNLKAFISTESTGVTNITSVLIDPCIYRSLLWGNSGNIKKEEEKLREINETLKKIFTTNLENYLTNLHYKIDSSHFHRTRSGLRLRIRRGFTYDFDTDRNITGLCNSCIFTTCNKCVYNQFSNELKEYLLNLTDNKF